MTVVITSGFANASDTESCSPPITPYLQVNCDGWQMSSSATVTLYQSVTFKPEPTTGGSWSWSGPDGFSASTREINISYITASLAGDYVVTYTNESGCKSQKIFTITICTPTEIIPYLRIDDGDWEKNSSATVNVGQTIMFRPQPVSGGSWIWSGPDGYSASTNEITISNISNSQFGNYSVTHTNTLKCNSYMTFTISNKGSTVCKSPVPISSRKGYTIETTRDGLFLNLQESNDNAIVTVYDIKGSTVYKNVCSKNKLLISGLTRNVYIIKIRQGQTELNEKFAVRR